MTEEQRKKLNANMPQEWVSQREGAGGRKLSYVQGWQVIDELNQILGPGEWGYDTEVLPVLVDEKYTDKYGKEKWRVTYNCKCTLRVGGGYPIGDYGTGHGIDADRGQAHESAIKEAATDALKRCAKSLGRRLGLALYDKDQTYVGEEEPPVKTAEERAAERKTETPEQKAERQAGQHESWKRDQPRFMAKLTTKAADGGLEIGYDELCEMLEGRAKAAKRKFVKPSEMSQENRDKLLAWLGSEEGGQAFAEYLEAKDVTDRLKAKGVA